MLATLHDVLEWVLPIAALPLIARSHRPFGALGWLCFFVLAPVLATVAYAYFHGHRLRGARRYAQRAGEIAWSAERWELPATHGPSGSIQDVIRRQATRVGRPTIARSPVLEGNAVRVLAGSDAPIAALVEAIDRAEAHVHLLYYLWNDDATGRRVAAAVERAAGRGVACRLLVGALATRLDGTHSVFDELVPRLERAGARVAPLMPVHPLRRGLARADLRNHRKLAVIDGRFGFVGSRNLHDADMGLAERDGRWRDVTLGVEGPAVLALQSVLLGDWYAETGERLASDEAFPEPRRAGDERVQTIAWGPTDDESGWAHLVVAMVDAARERLTLTTPYFVPNEPLLVALKLAACRDVAVDLVVPERSDLPIVDAAGRAYLGELLEAGVRIHHHADVVHAKTITVDGEAAVVGSGNLDWRSFDLNREAGVVVYGADVTRRIRDAQDDLIGGGMRIDLDRWRERSRTRDTLDHVAKLAGPLL